MGAFAPLGVARRRRKAAAERACLACSRGTGTSWKWLCDGCFAMLPLGRKREICAAREDRAPHRIYGLSRAAADWLAAERIKRAEAN